MIKKCIKLLFQRVAPDGNKCHQLKQAIRTIQQAKQNPDPAAKPVRMPQDLFVLVEPIVGRDVLRACLQQVKDEFRASRPPPPLTPEQAAKVLEEQCEAEERELTQACSAQKTQQQAGAGAGGGLGLQQQQQQQLLLPGAVAGAALRAFLEDSSQSSTVGGGGVGGACRAGSNGNGGGAGRATSAAAAAVSVAGQAEAEYEASLVRARRDASAASVVVASNLGPQDAIDPHFFSEAEAAAATLTAASGASSGASPNGVRTGPLPHYPLDPSAAPRPYPDNYGGRFQTKTHAANRSREKTSGQQEDASSPTPSSSSSSSSSSSLGNLK